LRGSTSLILAESTVIREATPKNRSRLVLLDLLLQR
jgi:hypothetical protein